MNEPRYTLEIDIPHGPETDPIFLEDGITGSIGRAVGAFFLWKTDAELSDRGDADGRVIDTETGEVICTLYMNDGVCSIAKGDF